MFDTGKPSKFWDTTNDDWVPSINVRPTEEEESPNARRKRHGVMIQTHFLKRKKLFHDAVCIQWNIIWFPKFVFVLLLFCE